MSPHRKIRMTKQDFTLAAHGKTWSTENPRGSAQLNEKPSLNPNSLLDERTDTAETPEAEKRRLAAMLVPRNAEIIMAELSGVGHSTSAAAKQLGDKYLTPKDAITLLNEMTSGVSFTVFEERTSNSSICLNAEIDGQIYGRGEGSSKEEARHVAAENAFKRLIFERDPEKDPDTKIAFTNFAMHKLNKNLDI